MEHAARDSKERSFAAATLQPALIETWSAIVVCVAKRSPAISQRNFHCKTSLQRCTIRRSLQSHAAAAVEGRAAANAAAAPSQAPFDLPCSSWRVLVAGALAMGATMVAPAVVAWRQQLAVQGSVLGATAFRRPRSPMAMRQTSHTTDLAEKQEFPYPRGSGCVRGVNPLLGAYLAGESNTAEVRMRDVSASTRVVAAVIIGTAVGGGTTRRVRCKIVVGEPVNRPGAMLACGQYTGGSGVKVKPGRQAAQQQPSTRAQRDAHRLIDYGEVHSRAKRAGAPAGKRAKRGRACCDTPLMARAPPSGRAQTAKVLLCGMRARAGGL